MLGCRAYQKVASFPTFVLEAKCSLLMTKMQLKIISKSLNNVKDALINWFGFVAIAKGM